MHLRSLTLKGFKSFPDRTRLEFGPGVSVVVGPNGSGKSNITDAVLWALGEQSPLAVRGQSMQDVIFGGARGQQARPHAEVELVLDNSDSALEVDWSEISILRRLDRTGEGEYRINGARCRLIDVVEALSDTGLGKEMHSVVSQGRVEAVVSSRPRDRRLLVEEAAGLGKHRKRRRRAQLKLERTQENLDRALDVEREARSRLRPLKRQAEAAELHARIERQSLQTRWELARDDVRERRAALAEAEAEATEARAQRDQVDAELAGVAGRREAAEEALATRGERREALSGRSFAVRAAHERVGLRLEQARVTAAALADRVAGGRARLEALEAEAAGDGGDHGDDSRLAAVAAELEELERARAVALDEQLAGLEGERREAEGALERAEAALAARGEAVAAVEAEAGRRRAAAREAEGAAEAARRAAARVAGELAAVDQFLSDGGGAAWMGEDGALADRLEVAAGYEAAVAAALGGRLAATVAPDRPGGGALLDRAGEEGGSVLVAGADARARGAPPAPGAEPLLDHVEGPAAALGLLSDAWVVERLDDVSDDFRGIAVTRAGRAWLGASRELRQVPAGGRERRLAERNRRRRLQAERDAAAGAERAAGGAAQAAAAEASAADVTLREAQDAGREAQRARDLAAETVRRAAWLIEQRRQAPDEGPTAVRRAQLQAELDAEHRLAERAERIREQRRARLAAQRERLALDEALVPAAAGLADALDEVSAALADHAAALQAELEADRTGGEEVAGELRRCAAEEARLQGDLRTRGERVTTAEVTAQQVRDHAAEAEAELRDLGGRLELAPEPADEALELEQREALAARIERLARRREQLGPVNPLAEREYEEAREYVDGLEAQRRDLETAMRELESLIAETDRRIRVAFETTFEATARNFEEVVGQLFPGGRGRLRLVSEDRGPRPVLGGAPVGQDGDGDGDGTGEDAGTVRAEDEEEELGVEIEMTPAGKSMKRLSLLSGGEKSLTALAFLFAIFLARPCPFYVLDEVEAALDDLNIDRFLTLLRRYSGDAQFIVVTHQKRTMEAADTLYGVSMGDDGVSKVISRHLPREEAAAAADAA
jgi:chromosome segregation protein